MLKSNVQEEIDAAITLRVERWQRTLFSIARDMARDGGCICPDKCGEDAGELDHSNSNCPVAIYLNIARLIVD
jgi:hypothetical protein